MDKEVITPKELQTHFALTTGVLSKIKQNHSSKDNMRNESKEVILVQISKVLTEPISWIQNNNHWGL
jgi:hypothetical protein